ncbi:MAG: hypothetical protein HC915_11670 [Anaerolineae bacterium]|nr:hypothetical protein [Anaerolineae bacterium]
MAENSLPLPEPTTAPPPARDPWMMLVLVNLLRLVFYGLVPLGLLGLGAAGVFDEVFRLELARDWLEREGLAIFHWWLITTLAGAAAFPILYRLFPGLPSRGYPLARSAGLMLTGFVFWFLAILGFLQNTPGSILLAWLLVISLAVFLWLRPRDPLEPPRPPWLRENVGLVLITELLFVVMLLGWALVRAHEPEIRSTEKPMEIMFVNSIRESASFPPNDGWLAGYSISYYYFGYVITAGLADLSGVNTGIAFGLVGPLLFALSGIGMLGVVYDLVRARDALGRWLGGNAPAGLLAGLLGAVMLVIMGNLGTALVERPWRGYAPEITEFEINGQNYFDFWNIEGRSRLAVDISPDPTVQTWAILAEDRVLPPGEPLPDGYLPIRDLNGDDIPDWEQTFDGAQLSYPNWDYWWWFRYSRVVRDEFLNGNPIGAQPITEFPHFSFILADIHPHVAALPLGYWRLAWPVDWCSAGAGQTVGRWLCWRSGWAAWSS